MHAHVVQFSGQACSNILMCCLNCPLFSVGGPILDHLRRWSAGSLSSDQRIHTKIQPANAPMLWACHDHRRARIGLPFSTVPWVLNQPLPLVL